MKRELTLLFIAVYMCAFYTSATAQNIGIGNPDPAGRLQINHAATATSPTLLLLDSADKGTPGIRFRNLNASTFFELKSVSGNSANTSVLDITHSSNLSALVTVKGNGNVGIGNPDPSEKLTVEGGTALNGSLQVTGATNLQGQLQINGSVGTPGQALVSNGTSNPVWQEMPTSYPANGRAMIPVTATPFPGQVEANLNMGTALYNTFGSAVSFATNTVTINTAGLYEIEGKLLYQVGLVNVEDVVQLKDPYATMRILANYGTTSFSFSQISEMIDKSGASGTTQKVCLETIPFKLVMHIPAGTILSFPANIKQYTTDACCDTPPHVSQGYIGILRIN